MLVQELLSAIGQEHRVQGPVDRSVSRGAPIDDADEDSLCFCSRLGDRGIEMIQSSRALVIICSSELDLSSQNGRPDKEKTLVQVANPRLEYAKLLQKFFSPTPAYGVHPTATVGDNVEIDQQVSIGPNVVVGENCKIGRGTTIAANVTIYPKTRLGEDVIIHGGAVTGGDGFGFEKDEATGEWVKVPQLGGVLIEDRVEIGSNTCIDRGALADTVLGEGTKVDNLVHIAHNVRVGKRCVIVAHVFLGGQVTVGDGSWIGPEASVLHGLTIGENALVGMGAVVLKNVRENTIVTGSPARVLRKNV
jgi:UDP-3-O-[3-hydroxymyristoyl] glucosamine N-acyltransferase